jgi:hypothetical protein
MILENQMSDKTVKVKVVGNYRVLHGDKPYVGGDTLTVPENVAAEWVRSGWVERITGKVSE